MTMTYKRIQYTMRQNLLLLKNLLELYKLKSRYMTSVSQNVYIDKLDDTGNEYNNTYHRTIKMKPANVKDNAYIDSSKQFKF